MNKNIPIIILCGGVGMRMKEETEFKPKSLVLIGNKPILWHIMKIYAHYGYHKFILTLGYKGEMIKDYFLKQKVFLNDFTLDTSKNKAEFRNDKSDKLIITFAETGLESLTGERILKVKKYLTGDEFMVTYGDGVADIDINKLVDFHRKQGTIGTITGVHPHSKYGIVKTAGKTNLAFSFMQKPTLYDDYISGGFMIFNKKFLNYLNKGQIEDGLIKLTNEKQLSVFKHDGFWKGMDTYREMEELNDLWRANKPWAVWEKDKKK